MNDYGSPDLRHLELDNKATSESQRVLRNAYGLLALSLLPTIAGAWFGISMDLAGTMKALGGGLSTILFLAIAFAFMYGINKTKDSGLGVVLLLTFTGFMGLMLSPMLGTVLGKANGASLVMTAFAGTAGVLFGMAGLASVIKRDLSWMGKFLFIGVLMLIVAGIANIFLQSSILMMTLSALSVGLFSAYLLYDIKQIIDGGERNYISATLSIYLSLFNIFQGLLSLLGMGSND